MATDSTASGHFAALMVLATVGLTGFIGLCRDGWRQKHERDLRRDDERLKAYPEFSAAIRLLSVKAKDWARKGAVGSFAGYPDSDMENCLRCCVRAALLAKPSLAEKVNGIRSLLDELAGTTHHAAHTVKERTDELLASVRKFENAAKKELGTSQRKRFWDWAKGNTREPVPPNRP